MSGNIPSVENRAHLVDNGRLPSLRSWWDPVIPLAPQNSTIESCCGCANPIRIVFSFVLRIFRAYVVGLVTCLIRCCMCCAPQRRRDVPPHHQVYTPEAQAVVDYIALANRSVGISHRAKLLAAFGKLSERARAHVFSEILRAHRAPLMEREDNPREIDQYISQFRREERKGQAPTEQEFVVRAITQFIQEYPSHRTIIEACESLVQQPVRAR